MTLLRETMLAVAISFVFCWTVKPQHITPMIAVSPVMLSVVFYWTVIGFAVAIRIWKHGCQILCDRDPTPWIVAPKHVRATIVAFLVGPMLAPFFRFRNEL